MHRKHHSATAANYLATVLCLALLAITPSAPAADGDDQQPSGFIQYPFAFGASATFVRSIDGVNYLQVLAGTEEELVFRNMIVGLLEFMLDR